MSAGAADVEALLGFGFPENKIRVALRECNNNQEQAIQFIIDHEEQNERYRFAVIIT